VNQQVITPEKIVLNANVADKYEAIKLAGELLVKGHHVSEQYIEKMIEREKSLTTFIGNGVAIPHGTADSKQWIQTTGISVVQIPHGVDFDNGNIAYLVIGIAAVGDEHLEILSNIALICAEEENVKKIIQSTSKEEIMDLFERGV
jgi:PTS system mannitol-specific IIA component